MHPDNRRRKVKLAQHLRRSPTDAERKLWAQLRSRRFVGFKFRRQAPIGPFVADFACYSHKVIVELDGNQHAKKSAHDRKRDAWLRAKGFKVFRFWNGEVFTKLPSTLDTIRQALPDRAPPAHRR